MTAADEQGGTTGRHDGVPAGEPDPWEAAREFQRADVAAALARHDWHCSNCGAVNPPNRSDCAQCGRPRVARARRFERGLRPWLLGGLAVLVLAAATALIVPGLREDADEFRAGEAARIEALAEAERRRQTIDMAPKRDVGPARRRGESLLAHRERLVERAERLITADARRRVAAGTMDGPVRGTECRTFPKTEARAAVELDPSLTVGRYSCIAYGRKVELSELEGQERVGLLGQPFYVVIQYGSAQLTWCKLTPRVAEGGKVLASVPLPVPCRDPEGPG